jgi:O-acetyl-ADP-ribose deacetylase (regulator of RNase III)
MKYLKKDISSVEGPAIIMHGVNCQRTMRSGVAKALFTKWPKVKSNYIKLPKEEMILGNVDIVSIEE